MAEDGTIPAKYALQETRTSRYPERTRLNIQDACGTAIFSRHPLSGGTKLTAELCQRLAKPVIVIDPSQPLDEGVRRLRQFVDDHHIIVLNVAGLASDN